MRNSNNSSLLLQQQLSPLIPKFLQFSSKNSSLNIISNQLMNNLSRNTNNSLKVALTTSSLQFQKEGILSLLRLLQLMASVQRG
ncbi:hypothetical protein FGO68_gene10751 [Halteria grandinella]|uniref:Uncharacterized protein n=1 Tax=Halteria grandinella TaxID=5974 RepID=A0A8J8NUD9_HALGN|nr:hypothetical protein FGO68_gene10751 [Halteria grandinella]